MKRSRIYLTIALALASGAFAAAPATACSSSGQMYEQPPVTKPLIELSKLNDAQVKELRAYAARLKAEFAVTEEKFQEQSKDLKDRAFFALVKEVGLQMAGPANAVGEALSFRTTVSVSSAVLCGGPIEIQLPPEPGNLKIYREGAGHWQMVTYGRGQGGGREECDITIENMPALIDRLLEMARGKAKP